jgi:hypothetical protein
MAPSGAVLLGVLCLGLPLIFAKSAMATDSNDTLPKTNDAFQAAMARQRSENRAALALTEKQGRQRLIRAARRSKFESVTVVEPPGTA